MKKRWKNRIVAAALVAASTGLSGSARAEVANWFFPLPAFSTDTFTIVLQGDQTAFIPSQNPNDTLTNPFAMFGGTPTITVGLVGGNTNIVYHGNAIAPGTSFPYPNNEPHFGLNAGTQPPGGFKILSETWSNSGSPSTQSLPALSIGTANEPSSGTFKFSVFFVQVNGSSVGQWFEIPFLANQNPPPLLLSNDTAAPLILSNPGFYISPTQIPLDDLNFSTEPPPGLPGSRFTPLPDLNGTTLAPGSTFTLAEPVPEPSSLVILSMGLVGLAGYRWRFRLRRG